MGTVSHAPTRRTWQQAILLSGLIIMAGAGNAWIYPEHRDIALMAVDKLDPDRSLIFSQLWLEARDGHESRFCARGAEADQGVTPDCIDWAALSGIAGDHSCSGQQMLDTVSNADWILALADVAAQLKVDLAKIPVLATASQIDMSADLQGARDRFAAESRRADRVNALRTADTRMQRVDVEYATRAGANNAHFLLARDSPDQTGDEYADVALSEGSEVNAIGVYTWYHGSALQKASRLASESLSAQERAELARAMLFDEAFALHFLEDVYASGHVAGTWGDASQRKGTHDFYNQNGLEAVTWASRAETVVLMGDAHMRPRDANVVSDAVLSSLNQVLDAAVGRSVHENPYRSQALEAPDPLNVCQTNSFPPREEGQHIKNDYDALLSEALAPTPIPSLGAGLGSMPRFRSELGPFLGLAGMIDGRGLSGGFETSQQNDGGVIGGLELSLRAGLGLEGALGESSDGLIFTSLGFRTDSPSTNHLSDEAGSVIGGNLSAAIPARTGLTFRMRMPYYLLPADLLLLSPMYFFAPDTYTRMAVSGANGGLLGLQHGLATPLGRFQFVLGREIGVTFYGLDGEDQLLAPSADPNGIARVVDFKSTSYELPILEFRPYRSFSMNQSSSVMLQFYGGVDIPNNGTVVLPDGAPPVDLDAIWFLGIRMAFDWRYYF